MTGMTEEKGLGRLYEGGRSTRGWHKNGYVESIDDLPLGTTVIWVNHERRTENLLLVLRQVWGPIAPVEIHSMHLRYVEVRFVSGTGRRLVLQRNWIIPGSLMAANYVRSEYFLAERDERE